MRPTFYSGLPWYWYFHFDFRRPPASLWVPLRVNSSLGHFGCSWPSRVYGFNISRPYNVRTAVCSLPCMLKMELGTLGVKTNYIWVSPVFRSAQPTTPPLLAFSQALQGHNSGQAVVGQSWLLFGFSSAIILYCVSFFRRGKLSALMKNVRRQSGCFSCFHK